VAKHAASAAPADPSNVAFAMAGSALLLGSKRSHVTRVVSAGYPRNGVPGEPRSWSASGIPQGGATTRAVASERRLTLGFVHLLFALEFNDSLDLTAVGTLALAGVTLWLVLVSRRALDQAQTEIQQTQREIELSRQEVEEAHRPVVIPVVDELRQIQISDSERRPARPFHIETDRVGVPITNIGSGPGLNVEVILTPRNGSDLWANRTFSKTVVGIGVRNMTSVVVYVPGLGGDTPDFDLLIRYADVAGKKWVTSATYLRTDGGHYTSLSIDTE
jgi:hypothetical protein